MERAKVLRTLIEQTGMNMKSFSEKIGIPYTTLYSILERGVGKASIDNVLKICRALGITAEEMDRLAFGPSHEIETIAAHHDSEEWTEEELQQIEEFKQFVRMRKEQRNKKE